VIKRVTVVKVQTGVAAVDDSRVYKPVATAVTAAQGKTLRWFEGGELTFAPD